MEGTGHSKQAKDLCPSRFPCHVVSVVPWWDVLQQGYLTRASHAKCALAFTPFPSEHPIATERIHSLLLSTRKSICLGVVSNLRVSAESPCQSLWVLAAGKHPAALQAARFLPLAAEWRAGSGGYAVNLEGLRAVNNLGPCVPRPHIARLATKHADQEPGQPLF